ncbi:MAG: hypothetical protein WD067_06585 [Gaiellaceae bacterium]
MRRLAALAACLALAGCGGSDDETDQPRQVGESAGLEVYEVSSQGFSIGVPPEWRVISVDEALPEADREELARDNPELAPLLEAIVSGEQPIKLFAFDPEVEDRFATNVNVLAVDLPSDVGLEDFVAANEADIEGFGGRVGPIASEAADLRSGPARRLTYRVRVTSEGRERTVATLQYVLVGDGKGYVVTFSTLPNLSGRYGPTFDRIVRSLRVD